jgi:hypothetical protein
MAKEDVGMKKAVQKEVAADEPDGNEKILAAIRRAAEELGRAPSRGELRRITGVSHYRVLSEFRTLREAVRAAGLEPNPKGEKISTEDLLADWKKVAEKLGRRPSRAEYVREGKYSAGAFVGRFGSWGKISTTEDTENHRGVKPEKQKRRKDLTTKDTKGHKGGAAKRQRTRESTPAKLRCTTLNARQSSSCRRRWWGCVG